MLRLSGNWTYSNNGDKSPPSYIAIYLRKMGQSYPPSFIGPKPEDGYVYYLTDWQGPDLYYTIAAGYDVFAKIGPFHGDCKSIHSLMDNGPGDLKYDVVDPVDPNDFKDPK